MRPDVANVISSAHSEFEYTLECNAPDAGILLNMESACAYFAIFGENGGPERPEGFLQEYIHSTGFRNSYRKTIPSFTGSPYGCLVPTLAEIQNLLGGGDSVAALAKWSEAKKLLPDKLKVKMSHYGMD